MKRIPAFSDWTASHLDALIDGIRFPLLGLQDYSDRDGEFRILLPDGRTIQICRHRFDYMIMGEELGRGYVFDSVKDIPEGAEEVTQDGS